MNHLKFSYSLLEKLPSVTFIRGHAGNLELTVKSTVDNIEVFVLGVMKNAGCSDNNAKEVATVIALAESFGVHGHGLNKLGQYFKAVKSGKCDGKATPEVVKENKTCILINGKNAPGPTIGTFAMAQALKKALEVGICVAATYDCTDLLMPSKYVLDVINNQCLGAVFSNNSPTMAPSGSSQVAIGSNPFSFGAPGKNGDYYLLNGNCTKADMGKIEFWDKIGKPIPQGWAITKDRKPETSAKKVMESPHLLGVGETVTQVAFKSYGMGVAFEILAGCLTGAAVGPEHKKYGDSSRKDNFGATFICIDPNVFTIGYLERMQLFLDTLRKNSPIGKTAVLIPGDLERKHRKLALKDGVLLHQKIVDHCNEVAKEASATPLNVTKV